MYWDYAATTPVKPEVLVAMMPYFIDKWYNPSAAYEPAREIRRDVEKARDIVAKSINADPEEIYFTSGGSESNSWIIKYVNQDLYWRLLTSQLEHSSINKAECQVYYLLNDAYGRIHIDPTIIYTETPIISVGYANNEIGTLQDIKSIADEAHKNHMRLHTDAVQAYGKIPIDVKALGIDLMSVSGHKIGAPKGIGFLYINKECKINPMIYGSQNFGKRGGTENVPYIMGLAEAVELIDYSVQDILKPIYEYATEQALSFAKVNGHPTQRLYNILSLTINEPIDGKALIGLLHEQGEYVSAGSACNAGSSEPSHVLKAIGLSDDEAQRTIRISFDETVTRLDIDLLFKHIKENIELLKGI